MSAESQRFNYLAWLTAVAMLVFLGGAMYSLIAKLITFEVFAATVGAPVSALVGWAARGAIVDSQQGV